MTHPRPDLPPPGSTVHRITARVLPVDDQDRVLLMHGWEPRHPDRTFWFTVGGALDPGEDHRQAAARELHEEVGIVVDPAELTGPIGVYDNAFDWGEWHVVQTETVFAVRVEDVVISLAGLDDMERATTDRADWWTPDDLDTDGSAVADHVTGLMRAAIAAVGASGSA